MKKTAIVTTLLISLAFSGAIIAKSSIGNAVVNPDFFAARQTKVTKEQARKIALERVKGEIVDEEYEKENGKMVYGFEIKQADGVVMEVKVDEMTGKVIYVGKDDGDADENDGDDDDDAMSSGSKMNSEMNNKQSEAELMKMAKISKADAEKIALRKANGTVEEGELEMENGKLVYSFDIRNKKGTISEVQVDARTGKIVSVEEEDARKEAAEKRQEMMERGEKDDDDNESPQMKTARMAKLSKEANITMEQARAIALKKIPGTITEEDLEKERGRLQYSFDIKDASGKVFDVEIDAKTGKVLKAVADTEDEDDNN